MPYHTLLADADYVERVAFDLIVNFERMLGRRISPAPLGDWLDYVALDGGLQPGDNEIRVYLVHRPEQERLQHFTPAHFADELNGKAFTDRLGEFAMTALAVEPVVDHDDLLVEVFEQMLKEPDAERVMLVAGPRPVFTPRKHSFGLAHQDAVRPTAQARRRHRPRTERNHALHHCNPPRDADFAQELLGYSLMAALGITAEEVNRC